MDRMVEILKTEYGAPVEKGVLTVMRYFNETLNVRDWPEYRFKDLIKELTKEDIVFDDPRKEARTVAMYLVQYTMLDSIGTDEVCKFQQVDLPDPADIPPLNPKTLLARSKEKALQYIEENSWHFAVIEDEEELDASGNPKPKKGSKGERSYELYCELVAEGASRKEIIEAFQSEDRMDPSPPHSKSGATTYFYNMKKKFESGT